MHDLYNENEFVIAQFFADLYKRKIGRNYYYYPASDTIDVGFQSMTYINQRDLNTNNNEYNQNWSSAEYPDEWNVKHYQVITNASDPHKCEIENFYVHEIDSERFYCMHNYPIDLIADSYMFIFHGTDNPY